MKVLEIDIKLDPVNDGARLLETEAIHKDEGALVIATNGKFKKVTPEEADDILEKLSGYTESEFMGGSPYIVIVNKDKTFSYHGGRYFIGTALVMKGTCKGLSFLTGDDYDAVGKEFMSRLVDFVANGERYPAYELQ